MGFGCEGLYRDFEPWLALQRLEWDLKEVHRGCSMPIRNCITQHALCKCLLCGVQRFWRLGEDNSDREDEDAPGDHEYRGVSLGFRVSSIRSRVPQRQGGVYAKQ